MCVFRFDLSLCEFGCFVGKLDLQEKCIMEALSLPPTPSSFLGSDGAGRGQWTTITPMTGHILVSELTELARCFVDDSG